MMKQHVTSQSLATPKLTHLKILALTVSCVLRLVIEIYVHLCNYQCDIWKVFV